MSSLQISGDLTSPRVAGTSSAPISMVQPAATFTSVTPTDGGSGTIVLTSAGAHGLTAAAAITNSIYISAGTGWTVGFYPITAVPVDTSGTTFTITGVFDAGMGAPTIALANTEVTMATVDIPPLRGSSRIKYDAAWGYTNSAGSKTLRAKFDGNLLHSSAPTTSASYALRKTIANRGVANSQVVTSALADGSTGGTNSSPSTLTVDTSVTRQLTFTAQPSAANDVVRLDSYDVVVFL